MFIRIPLQEVRGSHWRSQTHKRSYAGTDQGARSLVSAIWKSFLSSKCEVLAVFGWQVLELGKWDRVHLGTGGPFDGPGTVTRGVGTPGNGLLREVTFCVQLSAAMD